MNTNKVKESELLLKVVQNKMKKHSNAHSMVLELLETHSSHEKGDIIMENTKKKYYLNKELLPCLPLIKAMLRERMISLEEAFNLLRDPDKSERITEEPTEGIMPWD